MYKGISISPLHGSFASGYVPPPSDLEKLIAGRESESADVVNQPVLQSLIRGNVDVVGSTTRQNAFRNRGSLTQNVVCASFVMQSGGQGGL